MTAAARPLAVTAGLSMALACIAASCLPTKSMLAGERHDCHSPGLTVVSQPIYNVYYFVGAPLRAAAIVEQQKQLDPEWQEFQQFKAWKKLREGQADAPAGSPPWQDAEERSDEPEIDSKIIQSCARCHSGSAPKGGVMLDSKESLESLPAEARVTAMRHVLNGLMPPKSSLSAEEKGDIIQEFLLEGGAP